MRGQLSATTVAQLLSMQLDRQTQAMGRLENAFGLRKAESNFFAKSIHCIHQTLCMQEGQHAQNFVDIVVIASRKFWRRGVSTQKSCKHGDRVGAAQRTRYAQGLALVLQRQAVAGFDFNRGDALGHQALEPQIALPGQLLFGRHAGGLDGRNDAATRACDPFVAHTHQSLLKLARAVAAIDQVSVAIDQAGCDQRAACIVGCGGAGAPFVGDLATGPNPDQLIAFGHQRCIVNQAVGLRRIGQHRSNAAVRPNLHAHCDLPSNI